MRLAVSPGDFPPWQTVYGYFAAWRDGGSLRWVQLPGVVDLLQLRGEITTGGQLAIALLQDLVGTVNAAGACAAQRPPQ